MTRLEQTKYVAYQIYLANGKKEGFALADWRQAERLVEEYAATGQRCMVIPTRGGARVIVTISPGHSSY